jgi:hypothetical protein
MGRDDDAAVPADCLTLVMPLQAPRGQIHAGVGQFRVAGVQLGERRRGFAICQRDPARLAIVETN